MKNFLVLYEGVNVSLLDANQAYHHIVRSTTDDLKQEEVKAFLKDKLNVSFLHAPDFQHIIVPSQTVLLPSAVFDEALSSEYFERMYGACNPEQAIQTAQEKNLQIHIIYPIHHWVQGLLNSQFGSLNVENIFSAMLRASREPGATYLDLVIMEDHAYIGVLSEKKLWHSEVIEFQEVDDIIYTVLNVLSKSHVSPMPSRIHLALAHSSIELDSVIEVINKIEPLASMERRLTSLRELFLQHS